MAILFAKAARYRVDAMRSRCQAEAAMEEAGATLNLRYRANTSGERKTEAYYKSRIMLNPRYKRCKKALEEAVLREELAKLILDAYRMRRDGIKIISEHRGYGAMDGEAMLERSNQTRRLAARARQLSIRRQRIED